MKNKNSYVMDSEVDRQSIKSKFEITELKHEAGSRSKLAKFQLMLHPTKVVKAVRTDRKVFYKVPNKVIKSCKSIKSNKSYASDREEDELSDLA